MGYPVRTPAWSDDVLAGGSRAPIVVGHQLKRDLWGRIMPRGPSIVLLSAPSTVSLRNDDLGGPVNVA